MNCNFKMNLDEILINIFSFCDRSCLYPLVLSCKHIGDLAKLVIHSPNVLVKIFYDLLNEDFDAYEDRACHKFKFISWKKYINYKRRSLTHSLGYDLYININVIRVTDINIIKFMSIQGTKFFSSRLKINDSITYSPNKYVIEDDEPTIIKYIDIIHNIFFIKKCKKVNDGYYVFNDDDIKLIPRDILDHLDINCPKKIQDLIKYNFKITKESVLKALYSKCYQNLKVYINHHDEFKIILNQIKHDDNVHYENLMTTIKRITKKKQLKAKVTINNNN
jgi:hypothetical protein